MTPPSTTVDSFLARCVADLVTDCVLWTGSTDAKGYGLTRVNSKNWRAHRYVYTQLVGPIPDGLQLDHLCRVPCCVNPDHLEPVTNRENVIRGIQARPRPTHCRTGHAYDGAVKCRTCRASACRRWRQRQKGSTQ